MSNLTTAALALAEQNSTQTKQSMRSPNAGRRKNGKQKILWLLRNQQMALQTLTIQAAPDERVGVVVFGMREDVQRFTASCQAVHCGLQSR